MKHDVKITLIILTMFLITQFIGLYVINVYSTQKVINGNIVEVNSTKTLPYGMAMPTEEEINYEINFVSIIISFVLAILILFLLTRSKSKPILKGWFLIVTIIAVGITLNAFFPSTKYSSLIALGFAIPLSIFKIYKRNFICHNLSELLIYPGIAAVFVPLFNITSMILFLILISVYDMWAVWKSKFMQKMAKFQMDELKVFSGFFIPYASKKERKKIQKLKEQIRAKKISKKEAGKKGVKVNLAILGGGDIVFPIITSGVVFKTWGLLPAILVIIGSFVGLGSLLLFSKKKKFYPAMPFISSGIFLAMLISWLFL